MAIMLNALSNVYENIFFSASQPPDSSTISQIAGIAGFPSSSLFVESYHRKTILPTSPPEEVCPHGLMEQSIFGIVTFPCLGLVRTIVLMQLVEFPIVSTGYATLGVGRSLRGRGQCGASCVCKGAWTGFVSRSEGLRDIGHKSVQIHDV